MVVMSPKGYQENSTQDPLGVIRSRSRRHRRSSPRSPPYDSMQWPGRYPFRIGKLQHILYVPWWRSYPAKFWRPFGILPDFYRRTVENRKLWPNVCMMFRRGRHRHKLGIARHAGMECGMGSTQVDLPVQKEGIDGRGYGHARIPGHPRVPARHTHGLYHCLCRHALHSHSECGCRGGRVVDLYQNSPRVCAPREGRRSDPGMH